MSHALLTEILLGRPVKEVARALLAEAEAEESDVELDEDELEKVIKELIRVKGKNIRWHVCMGHESCSILVLNKKFQDDLFFDFWDDDGWAREDEAHATCEFLNEVTKKLFAVEDKPLKQKVTQAEFKKKKGKVCPYCKSTKVTSISPLGTWKPKDDWVANREMACEKCNAEWSEEYKLTITRFK